MSWGTSLSDTESWNLACARAVEVFGLPGDRFCVSSDTDHMIWRFRDRDDLLLFVTGWPATPLNKGNTDENRST